MYCNNARFLEDLYPFHRIPLQKFSKLQTKNNKLGLAKMGYNISKNVFIFDEIAPV